MFRLRSKNIVFNYAPLLRGLSAYMLTIWKQFLSLAILSMRVVLTRSDSVVNEVIINLNIYVRVK